MSSWLVCQREFSEISSDHVEFDFDNVVGFSVIDSNKVSNHIRHDNTIPQVGLYWGRLFTRLSVLFGFLTFKVESVVLMFDF